ncbi:hypothetical protein [Roseovarius sp.]|uniref:hypothetical protein n=1 Tax=Roseovarius sp. TaxID=1486281 RepID=UPI00356A8990
MSQNYPTQDSPPSFFGSAKRVGARVENNAGVHCDGSRLLSDKQLSAVALSLKNLQSRVFQVSLGAINGDQSSILFRSGIYAFIRNYLEPHRIYIGFSQDLKRRLTQQIDERYWANFVIVFETSGALHRESLRRLESQILEKGSRELPVLWENVMGPRRNDKTDGDLPPSQHLLNELSSEIVRCVKEELGHPMTDKHRCKAPTMAIGDKNGPFHAWAYTAGGWTFVLKGSRINSGFQTPKDFLASKHIAVNRGSDYFLRGVIIKKKRNVIIATLFMCLRQYDSVERPMRRFLSQADASRAPGIAYSPHFPNNIRKLVEVVKILFLSGIYVDNSTFFL